jgi:hypothetical protein
MAASVQELIVPSSPAAVQLSQNVSLHKSPDISSHANMHFQGKNSVKYTVQIFIIENANIRA